MHELKKIAAEMRESQIFNKGSLHKWADALDALAAQSAHGVMPPNLAHKLIAFANEPEGTVNWSMIAWSLHRMLSAQPVAAPQPAVPESFEKALERFSVSVNRRTYGLDSEAVLAEARAEVLRLYALAAAPAVKVPDGWKLVPFEPTPLMKQNGANEVEWRTRKEPPHLHVLELVWKAMLNAAPEPGK